MIDTPLTKPRDWTPLPDSLSSKLARIRAYDESDLEMLVSCAEQSCFDYFRRRPQSLDITGMQAFVDPLLALERSRLYTVFDMPANVGAGLTAFLDYRPDDRSVEIGWTWLGAHFRGTGLNKVLKNMMLDFAFDQLDVDAVLFTSDGSNKRSHRALANLGAEVTGVNHGARLSPEGEMRDSVEFMITKERWFMHQSSDRG